MSELRSEASTILHLNGGVTAENAALLMGAVAMHTRALEGILMRRDEARPIMAENTVAQDYPVPEELLPSRPLAFPGPPAGLRYQAYHSFIESFHKHLSTEILLLHNLVDFSPYEARCLHAFRSLGRKFRVALVELLQNAPAAALSSAFSNISLNTEPEPVQNDSFVCTTSADIWDIFNKRPLVRSLILHAPLRNERTARVPPLILDALVMILSNRQRWNAEFAAATLTMLASPLIPAITFDSPPFYLVHNYLNPAHATGLQYRISGTRATAVLGFADRRCLTITNMDSAVDSALFASPALASIETLVISDTVSTGAYRGLSHMAPAALSCLKIEFDGRPVPRGCVSLLASRGPKKTLYAHVETLKLAVAPNVPSPSSGPLRIPLPGLHEFVAHAFGHVPEMEVGEGLDVPIKS